MTGDWAISGKALASDPIITVMTGVPTNRKREGCLPRRDTWRR